MCHPGFSALGGVIDERVAASTRPYASFVVIACWMVFLPRCALQRCQTIGTIARLISLLIVWSAVGLIGRSVVVGLIGRSVVVVRLGIVVG